MFIVKFGFVFNRMHVTIGEMQGEDIMLQFGICDDNTDARLNLRSDLELLMEKHGIAYRAYGFSSGERLLEWLAGHKGELDLVFLDIEMQGMNGMETARRLREADRGLQLVFVTGYSEYVYDGYSVGALGYLLKPPEIRQLEDILMRAVSVLCREADEVFVCRSGDVSYRILRKDILYFASDRRQVKCVADGRTYTFYGKLDEVEERLSDKSFVRIHQRYLVHASWVERMSSDEVVLKGEAALPVSRSCQAASMAALTRAMLKKGDR